MNVLRAQSVCKAYGTRLVLRDIDLVVDEGERVVLLGDNGGGKSTLLHLLSGADSPDRGTVTFQGSVGFAPEKQDLPEHLVVGEWLGIMASLKGLGDMRFAHFGVDALRPMAMAALSLGQRQRVSLASACMGDPSLLILDEPSNALDGAMRDEVMRYLAATTCVVATHDREFAQAFATRTLLLEGGRLAEQGGGPAY